MTTEQGSSRPSKWSWKGAVEVTEFFNLSNVGGEYSEITFDYERAVGGLPFIETSSVVSSNGGVVEIEVVFSETFAGLLSETGMYSVCSFERS
jgi:hypothetical protein